jgi:transcriptional regulator with XRE-family HTH domain
MPYREPPDRAVAVLRSLGSELRRARYARGFSQAALAGHAAVSQSTVSMLERGLAPGLRISRYALMIAVLGRAPERPLRLRDRSDDLGPPWAEEPEESSADPAEAAGRGLPSGISVNRWADEPVTDRGDDLLPW